MKSLRAIPAALMLVLLISSCTQDDGTRTVSLREREVIGTAEAPVESQHLRIAVGAMITPRAGYAFYKQLLDYIGEKVGMKIDFVDKENYAEINDLLNAGDLDAAFVCSGPYVDGHEEFGLELLAMPRAYGETVYYSYIIVPSDSPAGGLEDLRGGVFAFTDPKSNTGKLVPTYMLARMGETPDSFFSKYTFTYAHDKSIRAVAMKLVDGAAVDSLIWEYADRTDPQFTSKTKVVLKSPPYGIPPFVVRPGLDPDIKKQIRRALLDAHTDEEGRGILKGMMIDRFVEGDDSAYDPVRQMKSWLREHGP